MGHNTHLLTEDFSVAGYWWLKRRKKNAVPGNLIFRNEKEILLELNGIFSDDSNADQIDLILGMSKTGERYALLNSYCSKKTIIQFPGFKVATYKTRILIVGPIDTTADKIRLKSAKVSLSGLEESAAAAWFMSGRTPDGFNLEWKLPKTRTVKIKQPKLNFSFSISHGLARDTKGITAYEKESALQHETMIGISPYRSQTLDWYQQIFADLRNLMTILHGFPSSPTRISAVTSSGPEIEILYPGDKAGVEHDPNPHHMFIRLQWLDQRTLSKVLRNWFSKSVGFNSVIQLVCGTMYQRGMYTVLEFSVLVQAMEAFHRNLGKGEFMPAKMYRPIAKGLKKAIPAVLHPDYRKKIEVAIDYGYQFDQRTRLFHLLNGLPADVKDRLPENLKGFVDLVINTRNYLTHYERHPSQQIYEEGDLAVVNKALRSIMLIQIYRELGVPDDLILRRYLEHADFKDYDRLKHRITQTEM